MTSVACFDPTTSLRLPSPLTLATAARRPARARGPLERSSHPHLSDAFDDSNYPPINETLTIATSTHSLDDDVILVAKLVA